MALSLTRRGASRAGRAPASSKRGIPYPRAQRPSVRRGAVRAAIEPRSKLTILDHITSPTALVLPIAEMVRACRERGVATLVDGRSPCPRRHIPLDIEVHRRRLVNRQSPQVAFCPARLRPSCGPRRRQRRKAPWLRPFYRGTSINRSPTVSNGRARATPRRGLSIPAAFAFMDRLGEENVRKHNHDLVMKGAPLFSRSAWGVSP